LGRTGFHFSLPSYPQRFPVWDGEHYAMRISDKQREGYARRVARCLVHPTQADDGFRGCPATIAEARMVLDDAGWTASETAFVGKGNTDWLVACQRGTDWMFAHGRTQLAAWRRAAERASQRDPRDAPPAA
jgi:hypothetical protein